MRVKPYLFFEAAARRRSISTGSARRRSDHAHAVQDSLSRPAPACARPAPDKVMHANLRIGDTMVMVSAVLPGEAGISGCCAVARRARRCRSRTRVHALASNGQVQMPLAKTFFSSRFGMVVDRFGVSWMIIVNAVTAALPPGRMATRRHPGSVFGAARRGHGMKIRAAGSHTRRAFARFSETERTQMLAEIRAVDAPTQGRPVLRCFAAASRRRRSSCACTRARSFGDGRSVAETREQVAGYFLIDAKILTRRSESPLAFRVRASDPRNRPVKEVAGLPGE